MPEVSEICKKWIDQVAPEEDNDRKIQSRIQQWKVWNIFCYKLELDHMYLDVDQEVIINLDASKSQKNGVALR